MAREKPGFPRAIRSSCVLTSTVGVEALLA